MTTPTADEQRQFAVSIVRRLRDAGHEAYWAGGCVRDLLLGLTPTDYDVATSAVPNQVRRLFRRSRAVGASFGVIRILGGHLQDVEVATFRTDASYSDGRHPDSVTFSTAREDAQRRDFTINGMFYDPLADRIADFVGGQEDLRRKVLSAIGDPRRRMAEDKLRMLRAARFAARFGFDIDKPTAEAVRAMADQLAVVSVERILAELRSMLARASRAAALTWLRDLNLLEQAFPEIAPTLCSQENWNRTVRLLEAWNVVTSFPLVLCGLVHHRPDSQAPIDVESILTRLKSSTDDRDRAVWLVQRRRNLQAARSLRLCILKRLFASPGFDELLAYHEAVDLTQSGGISEDLEYCRRLYERLTPEEINPPPLLTGHDLIAAGLRPGPAFKPMLERIRDEQLDGALRNKADALALARTLGSEQ